jgi:hypothetical protein
MGWKCGSRGRAPDLQAKNPEFKPQSPPPPRKKKKGKKEKERSTRQDTRHTEPF